LSVPWGCGGGRRRQAQLCEALRIRAGGNGQRVNHGMSNEAEVHESSMEIRGYNECFYARGMEWLGLRCTGSRRHGLALACGRILGGSRIRDVSTRDTLIAGWVVGDAGFLYFVWRQSHTWPGTPFSGGWVGEPAGLEATVGRVSRGRTLSGRRASSPLKRGMRSCAFPAQFFIVNQTKERV